MLAPTGVGAAEIRRVSPARHVLTLFGEYWWAVPEPLPTGAILAALADNGIKEGAARAAVARLVALDLLVTHRRGRRTAHALTDRARAMVADTVAWLRTFGRDEPAWDGRWSVIAFSVPEQQRSLRHASRSRLRWLGFAPLYDGVWISPRDAADDALTQLSSLGVDDVTAMRADLRTASPEGPRAAWDLVGIADRYAAFDTVLIEATAAVGGAPAAALAARHRLVLAWHRFREIDPALPIEVLPAPWPRAAAAERFAHAHAALGPAAAQRMREHVAVIDRELAAAVVSRRLD